MSLEKKNIKIEIFGDHYSLLSDEDEKDVLSAAKLIDSLMKDIADRSGLYDQKKIAVLAALQISSKLIRLESSIKKYETTYNNIIELIEIKGLSDSSKSLT